MDLVSEPPPPDKILTADRMADLAGNLEEALAKIEKWGICLHPNSRLQKTVSLLHSVASKGSFPKLPHRLLELGRAARDAREFVEIGGMLPDEPLRPVAVALKKATKGDASQTADAPRQFQSELWVGALLSCSTDFLGVPERDSRPDYIVRNSNMQYGVEVKRPTKVETVLTCADKGIKQLRVSIQHYHGGALVIDLTDCLDARLAATIESGPPNLEPAQEWIATQIHALHRYIYDENAQRIRASRNHIFAVAVVARSMHWDVDDLSQLHLMRHIGYLAYTQSPNSLRGHRATWLSGLFLQGAKAAGYHILDGHEIIFENPVR